MTGKLLTFLMAVFIVIPSHVQVANAQFEGGNNAPESVTMSPSSVQLEHGESSQFTIVAKSSEVPLFLKVEIDPGLEIVNAPTCGVDVLAYPQGSGPERSRMAFAHCTGGSWTDGSSGITYLEAGVPNTGMNPVSHKMTIYLTLRVSTDAPTGSQLEVRALERLTMKSLATVSVKSAAVPTQVPPTPIPTAIPTPQNDQTRKEPQPNDPFVLDSNMRGKAGKLIHFDLEPVFPAGTTRLLIELTLPPGTLLVGKVSCDSNDHSACRSASITVLDDGSTLMRWELFPRKAEYLNITVFVRLPESVRQGDQVDLEAKVGFPVSGGSQTEMEVFWLSIPIEE